MTNATLDHKTANGVATSLENGRLVVSLPFNGGGTPSSTGKTLVHATTSGNRPVKVDIGQNRTLFVGLTAFSK